MGIGAEPLAPEGVVYLARTGAGPEVALKVLHAESSAPDRVTTLVLRVDGTLARLTLVRSGAAFKVKSVKDLMVA